MSLCLFVVFYSPCVCSSSCSSLSSYYYSSSFKRLSKHLLESKHHELQALEPGKVNEGHACVCGHAQLHTFAYISTVMVTKHSVALSLLVDLDYV